MDCLLEMMTPAEHEEMLRALGEGPPIPELDWGNLKFRLPMDESVMQDMGVSMDKGLTKTGEPDNGRRDGAGSEDNGTGDLKRKFDTDQLHKLEMQRELLEAAEETKRLPKKQKIAEKGLAQETAARQLAEKQKRPNGVCRGRGTVHNCRNVQASDPVEEGASTTAESAMRVAAPGPGATTAAPATLRQSHGRAGHSPVRRTKRCTGQPLQHTPQRLHKHRRRRRRQRRRLRLRLRRRHRRWHRRRHRRRRHLRRASSGSNKSTHHTTLLERFSTTGRRRSSCSTVGNRQPTTARQMRGLTSQMRRRLACWSNWGHGRQSSDASIRSWVARPATRTDRTRTMSRS